MYRRVFFSVIVLMFLFLVSMGQSGGSYRIEKFVIPSGGTMAGGSYSVEATAGQSSTGPRQTGGSYSLNAGFWVPQLVPTAANVSVAGRVMTSTGAGLLNAIVTITDASGQVRMVRSSSFGYYVIEDVQAGQTYVITVMSKSHQFVPQIATVVENVTDLDFIALP